MKTLMRNGSRPSIGKPAMCHARKERVLLVGTDQWITSGPAARTAAFRGRIHGCTRTFRKKVRFFSLAPRAPSIHGTIREPPRLVSKARFAIGPCVKAVRLWRNANRRRPCFYQRHARETGGARFLFRV